MDITLSSGTSVTLKSFTRRAHLELVRLNAARQADEQRVREGDSEAMERVLSDEFFEKREAYVSALYPELGPWDDLPNRDAQAMINATWAYSVGMPEDEIKNSLRSGATTRSRTEPNTAEPAATTQP